VKLSEFLSTVEGELIGGDIDVKNICTDSRLVEKNDLFIALRGERFDGHDFVLRAQALGAVAVVVEQFIEGCTASQLIVKNSTIALGQIAKVIRQQYSGPLIAVTGSCGKTSVKGLLACIFARMGATLATSGNFNNQIGVPLTLNKISAEHKYVIVEVGTSAPGEIAYLADLVKPTIAVVNNIRPAHIGGFGSIEAIALEKAQLYGALENGQAGAKGTAVINLDDAFASQFILQTKAFKQIGFSQQNQTAALMSQTFGIDCIYASDIKLLAGGNCSFNLNVAEQSVPVALKVLGRHFVNNALAASACALAAGVPVQIIAAGLGDYLGDNGRMQRAAPIVKDQRAQIINDAYNANPGSMRVAIEFLASQAVPEKILILGDMGELGQGEAIEHTSIGIYALEMGITRLFAVGPLSALAVEAFGPRGEVFANLAELADALLPALDRNAVILLKGSRLAGIDALLPIILQKSKGRCPC
jgi:UDP-N-acetylmuramoyl-tripeptide--D-alanyl-D-alanine ligase